MTGIMQRLVGVLSILIAVCLFVPPAAGDPVIVNQDESVAQLSLLPFITRYAGDEIPDGVKQAALLPDAEYSALGTSSPLRLMQTAWFRFSIRNTTVTSRSLVFNLDQALLKQVALQATIDGVAVKQVVTGQAYPYASRDIRYDFFAFRLDVPAGATMTVDFSINTPYAALFIPSLTDAGLFESQITFAGRFAGAIMGMLYSISLFLFIYILRIRKLGPECLMWLFSTASFLSVLFMAGIIQRVLPEDHPQWDDITYLLIHGTQGFSFFLVLRNFYQTTVRFPVFDRILLCLAGIDLLCILAVPLVPVDYLLVGMLAANSMFLLVAFCLAVYSMLMRYTDTRLFSIGLLLFVAMTIVSSLAALGVLPGSLLARYGYELGLTIQVDFLFIAIVSHIFAAEREKLVMENQVVKLNAEMQARSEFVDKVTHDIKSPLSAVIGATQLMRDTATQEQRENYLEVIQSSCSSVIAIIDDILGFSRMKSGQMVLHDEVFGIAVLLAEMEASLRVAHREKPVTFSLMTSDTLPPRVIGDRLRLYQLLNNLLTNAFKFTDEGRISLAVDIVEKTVDRVVVRFVVQDTGIGMAAEFLDRAFEPYTREENRTGYRPGFGLGLSICKQITDLMHGTIEALSVPGHGSRFTVILPFDLPQ